MASEKMAGQTQQVNREKIKMAIQSGMPLSITTYTLPHEIEMYMANVLTVFLAELEQTQMTEYLSYCLSELTTNAKKANTKRVYFKEKNLSLENKIDYEKGMATFKKETLDNIEHYLQAQKNAGLYIKFILQTRNNKIRFEVRNNSPLLFAEYKRIHDKISRATQYTSMEQALAEVLDDSEGAGLGLIIMILMLQKLGASDENIHTLSENGETITRIILSVSNQTKNEIAIIASEFLKTIDNLPQFPQNITRLNKLISDPDSKLSDIAMQISNDVTLTAELLKLVNSAAFALSAPCANIADAIKYIGLRGIKNLLYSIGSVKSFEKISDKQESLWEHSQQTAFYAYNLARNFFQGNRAVIDDSYVAGLLHDMGKIIFETTHPDVLKRVMFLCKEKGATAETFEKFISGANHAEIGARVAEKWNFPDAITQVVRYHHEPQNAPADMQTLSAIVNFADFLSYYQHSEKNYDALNDFTRDLFKITSEAQFKSLSDRMLFAFEKNKH